MTAILNKSAWVKLDELPNYGGRFTVSPLDRGMGITLGNAMRRVLLSSLGGYAVIAIKINGVKHEFSTMSGVSEDVLDVIFNLKNIVFKSTSNSKEPKRVSVSKKGTGAVLASDLILDGDLQIVNPEQHIVEITDAKASFECELMLEYGLGFRPSESNKELTEEVDLIPIDSSFSPIIRVNHQVEKVRVGKELDHDKLVLDVWTDGSVDVETAVKQAADILLQQVNLFGAINEEPEQEVVEDSSAIEGSSDESVLTMSIDDLELTARSSNCLKRAGIETVGELVEKDLSELIQIKNFGKKSADEINDKLKQFSLALKGTLA